MTSSWWFTLKFAAVGLVVVGSIGIPTRVEAQSHNPALSVIPTLTPGAPNPAPFRDACLNLQSWPTGWNRLDFFGSEVVSMALMSDGELAQCFSNINASGKLLTIEVPVLKDHCTTGQECWTEEVSPRLTRFKDLGANMNGVYLQLDEPLTMVLRDDKWPLARDYNYAVDQTAEYIRLARQQFPNIKIIATEGFPTLRASDLKPFFSEVNNAAIARTGRGIEYAQLDHDWNGDAWFMDEVRDIQNYVRGYGIGFGVIFWAPPATGYSWYDGLMHRAGAYKAERRNGLVPDLYTVESWLGYPMDAVPESVSYTFTYSVRDFANTYMAEPTSQFGLRPNEYLNPGETRPSVDGRFRLEYQWDGNLVLYMGGTALWSSGTYGRSAGRAIMQDDGNFVVYDAEGRDAWSSATCGNPGAYLVVQSDGNMVVYSAVWALWASGTDWY